MNFLNKFVHEKGRRFYPALLPDDIERGKTGDCFDHCIMEVVRSKGKYFYCEGIAYIHGKWIHHAWMTDAKGQYAYDPTWRATDTNEREVPLKMVNYLGAVLETSLVVEFLIKTEYKSPLANHKKAPDIAQKIYDTAV